METFPCLYFLSSTRYPQSGVRIQLGNSYQFNTPPEAPDQRIFVLKLAGLQYLVTEQGQIDTVSKPERNMAVLELFYNQHKLAYSFIFNHPVYGPVTCKFNKPLEIPDGIVGGNGVLSELTVELIEEP